MSDSASRRISSAKRYYVCAVSIGILLSVVSGFLGYVRGLNEANEVQIVELTVETQRHLSSLIRLSSDDDRARLLLSGELVESFVPLCGKVEQRRLSFFKKVVVLPTLNRVVHSRIEKRVIENQATEIEDLLRRGEIRSDKKQIESLKRALEWLRGGPE